MLFALIPDMSGQDDDSVEALFEQLDDSPADTTRCAMLLDIAWKYYESDADTAHYYASLARDLAVDLGDITWQGKSIIHMARARGYADRLEDAKAYHQQVIELYGPMAGNTPPRPPLRRISSTCW